MLAERRADPRDRLGAGRHPAQRAAAGEADRRPARHEPAACRATSRLELSPSMSARRAGDDAVAAADRRREGRAAARRASTPPRSAADWRTRGGCSRCSGTSLHNASSSRRAAGAWMCASRRQDGATCRSSFRTPARASPVRSCRTSSSGSARRIRHPRASRRAGPRPFHRQASRRAARRDDRSVQRRRGARRHLRDSSSSGTAATRPNGSEGINIRVGLRH